MKFPERVRVDILSAYSGYCADCTNQTTEIHHRLANTKTNRKLFPLFIQSIFNAVPLCRECHSQRSHKWKVELNLAAAYEQYLKFIWSPYIHSDYYKEPTSHG